MASALDVLGFVANGIVLGSILALAAIGLTLVYGILKLANFAHGDLLTLGAFGALFFAVELADSLFEVALSVGLAIAAWVTLDALRGRLLGRGERAVLVAFAAALLVAAGAQRATAVAGDGTTDLTLLTAALLSVVVAVALAAGLEFLLWRPLRRRRGTILAFVIVSIGVSLVVRNSLQLHFGGGVHSFDRPTPVADVILGARISDAQQFTLVAAVAGMVLVHLFLKRTRTGKAMRALADNVELARVSGIDVNRVILHVWGLAGALTAVAGVLLSLVQNNTMFVNMGFGLILPLFATVILGGIGHVHGAMVAGFLVGIAMKTSTLWVGSEYELATAFLLLIAALVLRPQGLLGGSS